MRLPAFRPPAARTFLITAAGSLLAAAAIFFSTQPTMHVDGHRMTADVPVVTSGRATFLPLRAVALGLGAVTSYDKKTGIIEVMRGADTVRVKVGERKGTLNGKEFTLRRAPFIMRGRVMVPSGLFETALGSAVHYDRTHEHIDVITGRGGHVPRPAETGGLPDTAPSENGPSKVAPARG